MKRYLLLLLLLTPFISKATHLAGEEMYYTYLGNNTYRVTLAFYATCKGGNYDFMYDNPDVKVYVTDSNNVVPAIVMHLGRYNDGLGDSVNTSTYCPTVQDNCNIPTSTYQGYVRYCYSGTVTLPHNSTRWYFWFRSEFRNCGSFSGRNTINNFKVRPNVLNPSKPDHNNIALCVTLNDSTNGPNSSVKYNTLSKFDVYCPTTPNSFRQASTDVDNDSVAFKFSLPPWYWSNDDCAPIEHVDSLLENNGYTYAHPLPGNLSLNSKTGQFDFDAGGVSGDFLAAFTIYEYRNGVLVGTSVRERIFRLNSTYCATPAIGHIDTSAANLHGALATGQDTLTTCAGGVISFKVPVAGAATDTVLVYFTNITTGSNVTVNNNNTPNPICTFNWNTAGVPNGVYTMDAVFNTKSCPLPSVGYHTFTIIIGDGGTIVATQLSKTNCINKAQVRYQLSNGFKPYTVTLMQGSTIVKTFTNSTGVIDDSLTAGSYLIKLTSTGLPCSTITNFVVADSGTYPYQPHGLVSPVEYCRNGDAKPLIASSDSISTLKWYDPTMTNVPPVPTPSTATGGTFYWYVSQMYKTCESAKDTIAVIVSQDECNYDVKMHNVITPNGDGKNDKWIVENLELYPNTTVQIFDKLGDKVFESTNYQNNWEGDALPSGMYYYLVKLSTPNRVDGKTNYTGYLMIKR
jgi:gliding motility-associated-like protein